MASTRKSISLLLSFLLSPLNNSIGYFNKIGNSSVAYFCYHSLIRIERASTTATHIYVTQGRTTC